MSLSEHGPNPNRRVVRIVRLGEEPPEDVTTFTTASERFEWVRELALRLAEFEQIPAPRYSRSQIPIRVIRR